MEIGNLGPFYVEYLTYTQTFIPLLTSKRFGKSMQLVRDG